MKSLNKILPANRKVTFFISLVALLLIFFVSFYYYYVPANKENLNKYAYLVLENIKTNISVKNSVIKEIYPTYLDDIHSKAELQQKLDDRKVEGKILTDTLVAGKISEEPEDSAALIAVSDKTLKYRFKTGKRITTISVPIADKFKSFFDMHRKELFNSFLLLKVED